MVRGEKGNALDISVKKNELLYICVSVILDYPQHGYVLYRTIIIKTCVYTIYTCRARVPAPINDHLIDHPV